MTAPHIKGRYLLYKEGADRIVRWLMRNGKRSSRGRVKTPELTYLAASVANSATPVEIPASILDLLLDVISGRSICAD